MRNLSIVKRTEYSHITGLIWKKEQPYSLWVKNIVTILKAKTTQYGTESYFEDLILWNALQDVKNAKSIQLFKKTLNKLI